MSKWKDTVSASLPSPRSQDATVVRGLRVAAGVGRRPHRPDQARAPRHRWSRADDSDPVLTPLSVLLQSCRRGGVGGEMLNLPVRKKKVPPPSPRCQTLKPPWVKTKFYFERFRTFLVSLLAEYHRTTMTDHNLIGPSSIFFHAWAHLQK